MNNHDAPGIYAIENLMNGRVYVGATKSGIGRRWRSHVGQLHSNSHDNTGLRYDAEIYGACAFRCILLQELPPWIMMAPFEQFWINHLRRINIDCYNVAQAFDLPLRPVHALGVPPEYDLYLTAAEEYLRYTYHISVPAERIYRDVRSGELLGFFNGRKWFVRSYDLSSYLVRGYHRLSVIRTVNGQLTSIALKPITSSLLTEPT